MLAIGGWEGAFLDKKFNRVEKLADILTAALLPFEIVAELLPLHNAAHDADSERTHLFRPCLNRLEALKVFPAARLLQRLAHGDQIGGLADHLE